MVRGGFKLAHIISKSGLMSRRKAESVIIAGRVTVDGVLITTCASRFPEDVSIKVDGQTLTKPKPLLFLLYKPIKYLVTHAREGTKANIFDLMPPDLPHLTYVGRLDYMSEGLLLLTNSPDLANELGKVGVEREYSVLVDHVSENFRNFVKNPILDNLTLLPIKISGVRRESDKFNLTLILKEGRNREIRRACALFKMKIFKLKRERFGKFVCPSKPGQLVKCEY